MDQMDLDSRAVPEEVLEVLEVLFIVEQIMAVVEVEVVQMAVQVKTLA